MTWTAAELARILALRGDPAAARQILGDPAARIAEGEPGSATALLIAEAVIALAEGDPDTARSKSAGGARDGAVPRGVPNPLAAQMWWTARLVRRRGEVGGRRPGAPSRPTADGCERSRMASGPRRARDGRRPAGIGRSPGLKAHAGGPRMVARSAFPGG